MDWKRRSYSKEEFTDAWLAANSIREVAESLGLAVSGGTYKSLKIAAFSLSLNTEHMTKPKSKVGDWYAIPLDRILVENSQYSSSSTLRKRLIKDGILEAKCSAPFCPIPSPQIDPWTGEETEPHLTLDHINGDNTDNRIENLRILCSYCHAHTPTFCGKHKRKAICNHCGIKTSDIRAKYCASCAREINSIFHDIPTEELIAGVEKYGYLRYAKNIGASDNGLRKRLVKLGISPLPRKKNKV